MKHVSGELCDQVCMNSGTLYFYTDNTYFGQQTIPNG
jgi:hypothetical protein